MGGRKIRKNSRVGELCAERKGVGERSEVRAWNAVTWKVAVLGWESCIAEVSLKLHFFFLPLHQSHNPVQHHYKSAPIWPRLQATSRTKLSRSSVLTNLVIQLRGISYGITVSLASSSLTAWKRLWLTHNLAPSTASLYIFKNLYIYIFCLSWVLFYSNMTTYLSYEGKAFEMLWR